MQHGHHDHDPEHGRSDTGTDHALPGRDDRPGHSPIGSAGAGAAPARQAHGEHQAGEVHDHAPDLPPSQPHVHNQHAPASGVRGVFQRLGLFHSHEHALASDAVLESSEQGIRAVKLSLVILAATAAFQVAVVAASGSVALLADTIHNFSDALTALPLWLAFVLSRRAASRRFTYGHGRAEDLAGLFIVLMILASALVAGFESYRRIVNPEPLQNVGWVMAAAVIGFIGNEVVAMLRTRTGKEIGSAALIADGQHARVDGLTSLGVLFGALGVVAGAPIADPIVGAIITIAILFIVKDAAVRVWHRMMDAVDPGLLDEIEEVINAVVANSAGARGIDGLRVRWLGHKLQVELNLLVDEDLSTRESHRLAEELRHALFHAQPQLSSVLVHVDPDGDEDSHALTADHAVRSR